MRIKTLVRVTVALRGGLSRQHYSLSTVQIDKTEKTALVVIDGLTYGYANIQSINIDQEEFNDCG